ncbi:hypothetical protein GWI33_007853 [Rhynchophorus ferrugineus]|uniref:Uncharacterized protein n=1 Tax=Rhynchophorus ferrugineus TaxID=354439 RepID=A0A834MBL4_RHYFE|nr:hypothetical protein GWI33_007853 [Rhynchophorus ferrugineus]
MALERKPKRRHSSTSSNLNTGQGRTMRRGPLKGRPAKSRLPRKLHRPYYRPQRRIRYNDPARILVKTFLIYQQDKWYFIGCIEGRRFGGNFSILFANIAANIWAKYCRGKDGTHIPMSVRFQRRPGSMKTTVNINEFGFFVAG